MNPYTILVVEDNPITVKMARLTLKSAGYTVLEAPDGRTALELMANHAPALVLQDLLLPDMDGLDLLKQLRALPGGAEVPILAFSGFQPKLDDARASSANFTDFLIKPVEPSRLLRTIQSYLPPPGPFTEAPGGRRRVLVVDDDAIQRKLLAARLAHLGFQADSAVDGMDALDQAQASPPDAILSDVLMPRLDGFGLCLAVRRNPLLVRVPVVLVSSSYIEEADRRLAHNAGANAFVLRTPDFQEAIEALLAGLSGGPPPPPQDTGEELEAERARRVLRQLERQAARGASLAQRCALQAMELSILSGITEALARAQDIGAVLGDVLARCADAGGISLCALYLTAPDGRLLLRAQVGHPNSEGGQAEAAFGHPALLARILAGGIPVAIPSATVSGETARDFLTRCTSTSALVVPVGMGGNGSGILLMGSTGKSLAEEDWLAFAQTVAGLIGQTLERVKAEESRSRLVALLEATPDFVAVADARGRALYLNTGGRKLLGIGPDEDISGFSISDGHADRARAVIFGEAMPAAIRDGVWRGETALLSRDGREIPVAELIIAHKAPGGSVEFLSTIARDMTERNRAEEALRQTEKLASMGQLLAGVAHELNNPLSVAMGQATLLAANLQGSPLLERAEKIVAASERCARIVGNFLALARQRPPERKHVVLNQVVEQAVELLAYPLRVDTVKVRMDLDPDLPVLWADPHQLHQVVVNLISNAHQAMRDTPPPRALTLVTRFDPATGRVVLAVADTGPGIPPHIRTRIFEPFFTTKPPGQGTGLGLSLCQGIIEGHGGAIRVESQPGEGATFVIELLVSPPPAAAPEARAEEAAAPLREKSILIVDDEPVIVELLADILSLDGHQIETAADGALALEKLRERTYDLILSDIRMPMLDGPGLYREVQRRQPELCRRFVFITGDILSRETREFLEETGVTRVSKPISLEEVRRVVQRALAPPAISSRGTPG